MLIELPAIFIFSKNGVMKSGPRIGPTFAEFGGNSVLPPYEIKSMPIHVAPRRHSY